MGLPQVLLADDQPEMLREVSELLRNEFEVVDTWVDGRCVIDSVACLDPDLLALDISIPVMNGIEAAENLKRSASRAKIVFLTSHEDRDYVEAAFSAGALGYVLKPRLTQDLIQAKRGVLGGCGFVSSPLGIGL